MHPAQPSKASLDWVHMSSMLAVNTMRAYSNSPSPVYYTWSNFWELCLETKVAYFGILPASLSWQAKFWNGPGWDKVVSQLDPNFLPSLATVPCEGRARAVRGLCKGLFPPRQFLPLHKLPGDDLTWPLSPNNPFWSGESAEAAAARTIWPRLTTP